MAKEKHFQLQFRLRDVRGHKAFADLPSFLCNLIFAVQSKSFAQTLSPRLGNSYSFHYCSPLSHCIVRTAVALCCFAIFCSAPGRFRLFHINRNQRVHIVSCTNLCARRQAFSRYVFMARSFQHCVLEAN